MNLTKINTVFFLISIFTMGLLSTGCSTTQSIDGTSNRDWKTKASVQTYSLGYGKKYREQNIHGWRVMMSNDMANRDPNLAKVMVFKLEQQLKDITERLPAHTIPTLRQVPIWVEYESGDRLTPFYHPHRDALKRDGVELYKHKAIEIPNAKTYLAWTRIHQYILLHEMAHAWHHRGIGFENNEIARARNAAMNDGKYLRVVGRGGYYGRAYAATNQYEYFAELSEAYFAKNDYFPYDAIDLQTYDPRGYALIQRLWGLR